MARLQAHARIESDSHAPDAARILPLLRHLEEARIDPSQGLRAVRIAKARRRKLRIVVVTTTLFTMLVVTAFVVRLPKPSGAPSSGSETSTPPRPAPTIVLRDDGAFWNARKIADTRAIREGQRVQRIDGLFDALKEEREHEDQAAPPAHRLLFLSVSDDTEAVVVKSVFQTAAFAGYDDIRFLTEDARVIGL